MATNAPAPAQGTAQPTEANEGHGWHVPGFVTPLLQFIGLYLMLLALNWLLVRTGVIVGFVIEPLLALTVVLVLRHRRSPHNDATASSLSQHTRNTNRHLTAPDVEILDVLRARFPDRAALVAFLDETSQVNQANAPLGGYPPPPAPRT